MLPLQPGVLKKEEPQLFVRNNKRDLECVSGHFLGESESSINFFAYLEMPCDGALQFKARKFG